MLVVLAAKIAFVSDTSALVLYKTNIDDEDINQVNMINLFLIYYAKILYNIGYSSMADNLIQQMQNIFEESHKSMYWIDNQIANILGGNKLLDIAEVNKVKKVYNIELHENNGKQIIQTYMTSGNTKHFAPLSVLMLLQDLINILQYGARMYLLMSVAGMNQYYREKGRYYRIKSIVEAPQFGMFIAQHIMSGDKNKG